jgi:MFS family permease
MFNPSLSSLVSKSANANEKGLFLGQYQSACALGRILGPTFSGILFSQIGTSAPLYTGAMLGIPVIVLITNFALRRKNEGIE